MKDLLIQHAVIVDGSGAERYAADILVHDGRIARIGDIDEPARETINARGLIVSPGFIDWHSHSDFTALLGGAAKNILEQGITLEVAGQCGTSAAPLDDRGAIRPFMSDAQREAIESAPCQFAAFLREVRELPPPTNMAFFVGHGNLRAAVCGYEDRDPTAAELDRMKELLRSAMESGALGFTSGLIYPPGSYAKPWELTELARTAAGYEGAMYATHIRSEGDDVVRAVQEALTLGRDAGIPVTISHHKVGGADNRGKSVETLRLIDAARAAGQRVYLDQYPYAAGATSLISALPPRYAAKGIPAFLKQLEQRSVRDEITALLRKPGVGFENMIYGSGLDGVIIAGELLTKESGMTLAQLGKARGQDPYDAMYDLLIESGGEVEAVFKLISPWDVENIMRYPHTMTGTDAFQFDGPRKHVHPRILATFPKKIGEYCRDKGFFTLEECIRRMTGLPAQCAGFRKKGLIREGMDADIVIFDFDTISGRADHGRGDIPNEGIEYVFVNGVKALEKGKVTGKKGGKVLLRGGAEA